MRTSTIPRKCPQCGFKLTNVKCPTCGYEWWTTSKAKYVACSRCTRKFRKKEPATK